MIFLGEIPVSLGFNSLTAKVRHTNVFVEYVQPTNLVTMGISRVDSKAPSLGSSSYFGPTGAGLVEFVQLIHEVYCTWSSYFSMRKLRQGRSSKLLDKQKVEDDFDLILSRGHFSR